MFVPDSSNVFQINNIVNDANLPAISIRCPHCRELGSFDVVRAKAFQFSKTGSDGPNRYPQNYFATIRICPNIQCKGLVFVIEANGVAIEIEPPQLIGF